MFKEIHGYSEEHKNKIIRNFIDVNEDKKTVEYMINFLRAENYPDFNTYIHTELEFIGDESSPKAPAFVRYGRYSEQIKRLLKYFNMDQILIIENNDLKNNTNEVLERVCNFLDVEKFSAKIDLKQVGVRKYSEPIKIMDKEILSNFYKPFNKELFELVGEEYNWV